MDKPLFTRVLERMLNPIMGKSVVMYFLERKAKHERCFFIKGTISG